MEPLRQALIFLIATVIAVPISKRLGLGTVLGYIVAGIVIGPWLLAVIKDVDDVMQLAELGVALLLFMIGLELQPERLWQLRRTVFVTGSFQMLLSASVLGGAALLLGADWRAALLIGFGLSLSSTAFALQLLGEKKDLASPYGQTAFGILLLQDLAVIPLLAIVPMLATHSAEQSDLSWSGIVNIFALLGGLVLAERFVLRRFFRIVAATRSQDVFTAASLLIALGTAALVNFVGMSMALGAFLAGGLLANSEYRHELEADIEPFKGLLLGLFFISVGMSVNLKLVIAEPLQVIGIALGILVLKAIILFGIGRFKLADRDQSWRLALAISQGGEFAFVLFGVAVGAQILSRDSSDLLIAAVTLSMVATPVLFTVYERIIQPFLRTSIGRDYDVVPDSEPKVIIAGFGRVGQVVARVLRAKRIAFTALDSSPEHIDFVKRFGNKVFYGDASRIDLLRAARADRASVFVLAIDDVEASIKAAQTLLANFPHLTIIARARNRQHTYELLKLGITHIFRETFGSSLELTAEVLQALGESSEDAQYDVERFRKHDEQLVLDTYQFHDDDEKLVQVANQARAELESIFESDVADERKSA